MWVLEKMLITYVAHIIFLLDRAVLDYMRNSYIVGGKRSGNPREKWVEGMNTQFTKGNQNG